MIYESQFNYSTTIIFSLRCAWACRSGRTAPRLQACAVERHRIQTFGISAFHHFEDTAFHVADRQRSVAGCRQVERNIGGAFHRVRRILQQFESGIRHNLAAGGAEAQSNFVPVARFRVCFRPSDAVAEADHTAECTGLCSADIHAQLTGIAVHRSSQGVVEYGKIIGLHVFTGNDFQRIQSVGIQCKLIPGGVCRPLSLMIW